MTPVQADLEVSPTKISYDMKVSQNVRVGGEKNIIATAVREALALNNADVLISFESQLNYDASGEIRSVNITGYPAKYVNFRNCENVPAIPVDDNYFVEFCKKK